MQLLVIPGVFPFPPISTQGFFMYFLSQIFLVSVQNRIVNDWQNDPLINTGHVSVLYVLTCRRESSLYVKFYEWLFFNLCI